MRGVAAPNQSSSSPSWGPDMASSSYTPLGLPSQYFSGPLPSPFLHAGHQGDPASSGPGASPNYFGLFVDSSSNPPDSNPGPYARKNWEYLVQPSCSVPSPRHETVAPTPTLKQIFQSKQRASEAAEASSGGRGLSSPRTRPDASVQASGGSGDSGHDQSSSGSDRPSHVSTSSTEFPFQQPKQDSSEGRRSSSATFPMKPVPPGFHLSLSAGAVSSPAVHQATSPTSLETDRLSFATPERCAKILQEHPEQILVLDTRPYPQYAQANIRGSLNLCIPTTLLKRASFNTDKLRDTFVGETERRKFCTWRQCNYIIVYDSNTESVRDATTLINMLKKFRAENWQGEALILRGGFAAFSREFPQHVQRQTPDKPATSAKHPRSMSLQLPSSVPVAGGCSIPDAKAIEPFFSNIRQNMDLVGGVGQVPVRKPTGMTDEMQKLLPSWLRGAVDASDKGHIISQRFLRIEEQELRRMREALSPTADYGPGGSSTTKFRVAGLEKGSKNRYNDIYPFDHSRVRLQDVPEGSCDYVNANHVKAEYTNKSYIATQAPLPETFADFWRVAWEQDVRVIVALTAEVERGQIKCHPYWSTGTYGPFKVKVLAERRISMDSSRDEPMTNVPEPAPSKKRSLSDPDASKSVGEGFFGSGMDNPEIIVRHLALTHSGYPFQPIREITQLQYSHWPDFGTSQPSHLLKLVEQCDKITRMSNGATYSNTDAEPAGQRSVIVHCSAGCGRTGTFCTVDSVLDMLKRQRASRSQPAGSSTPGWVFDDNTDLIAKTVEDFRTQRPSMVQNLSQFVLCYECILEWAVRQLSNDASSEQ